MRALRSAALLGLVAAACGAPGSQVVPPAFVSGTYKGTDPSGGLTWTMQQSYPGEPVTGAGTFTATGDTTAVAYSLRGTYKNGVLVLRLVGAPGDTNADSVWFRGQGTPDLYAGAVFSGVLYGPTAALFGSCMMSLSP